MHGFLLFALFILLIGFILKNISGNSSVHKTSDAIYIKKNFLTTSEKEFLSKLKPLEQELNLIIIPQVNLASVIKKVTPSRYQTELFRNVDFGIFNNNYELLLLIELNDQTHNQNNRKKRDRRVKDICRKAGIKLISFYTSYSNEQHYIEERIKKELNNLNN